MRRRLGPVVATSVVLALGGCSALPDALGGRAPGSSRTDSVAGTAHADSDAALGWGPTAGELAAARELVGSWTPEELAGQVIVGRYHGTDPEVPARLVRDLHLAGVSVQSENVVDTEQVRATARAVATAVTEDGRDFPPVLGVDQEGGVVAHLDGIATDFPAYSEAGEAIEADRRTGRQVVHAAARASGLELRSLGFTWVWAPVADVTIGYADPTIGSRSPSEDPRIAARATEESIGGYNAAGIVSTTKHFPGHGAVVTDSHEALPELTASLAELRGRDLRPFRAAVEAGAPAIMMSHIGVDALAPGVPATLAGPVYDLLRDDLAFDGVAVTDSLGMGAVLGQGRRPPIDALIAGADLLLMPVDTARAHRLVTAAVRTGTIPRSRIEDAAATVVAVQRWQARVASEVTVPADVSTLAAEAAAALAAAG